MAVPTRKAVLEEIYPSVGMLVGLLIALTWQAASALLGLASLPSTSWHGLCQQSDWAPYRLSARARVPGDQSWSLQGLGPNSAAISTLGSLKRIVCHWWLVCSNMLACPWWSLEGLLMATQNQPIFYQKVLVKTPQLVSILVETVFFNKNSSACMRSCRAPVEDGLWIHSVVGHWVYQKKKEEEQINVVWFILNEN